MKRRDFIKLACATILAPLAPLSAKDNTTKMGVDIAKGESHYFVLGYKCYGNDGTVYMHARAQGSIKKLEMLEHEGHLVGVARSDAKKDEYLWIQISGPCNVTISKDT